MLILVLRACIIPETVVYMETVAHLEPLVFYIQVYRVVYIVIPPIQALGLPCFVRRC